MSDFINILAALSPAVVALIGIIPAIIANRKKTQQAIDDLKEAFDNHKNASTEGCKKIQATLEAHIRENEDSVARDYRYRILCFYDELCERLRNHTEIPFSEIHFADIIEDIDNYEAYCKAHPDFKNNRGAAAMKFIKETYSKLKEDGKFLSSN